MSMKTRVTELLGIEAPVVQGAMARIADASLAGAVSEELVVERSKNAPDWRNPVWRHADGAVAEW